MALSMKEPNDIFVFGSNLAGRHGKGAAYQAIRHYGAIYGQARGIQGRSYAIPTKDDRLKSLPLPKIAEYVEEFLDFARNQPHFNFVITAIGCGLAGYQPFQIAWMFEKAPSNCYLPIIFETQLGR